MRILYLGDVVGRAGRTAVIDQLPGLRRQCDVDFALVNCENAAGGFGVTEQICQDMFGAGADVLTSGNHIWDQREILPYMEDERRLLRPLNYPANAPGRGTGLYPARNGQNVLVINAQAQLFMPSIDDPFAAVDEVLATHPLGEMADVILVDFHGEATSEKMAMGHLADGRASLVVGSHTHVPTSDVQILPLGTGYQTDAGMCGDYDSVIGMDKHVPLERFTSKLPSGRLTPAMGEVTICGLLLETNASGLAAHISALRVGGRLSESLPTFSLAVFGFR